MKRTHTRRIVSGILAILLCAVLTHLSAHAGETDYWQKPAELMQARKPQEALEEIVLLLEKMPENVLLLRLKGICLLQLHETDRAVRVLHRAAMLDPSNTAVHFYLANALAEQGRIPEATDLLVWIKDHAPESPYAQVAREVLPRMRDLKATMRPDDTRKRWSLFAGVSKEYDDNVPARSRHGGGTVTDSFRTVTSGTFEFRVLDQYIDRTPLSLGARHSAYYSWHWKNKFSSYDLGIQSSDLFLARSGVLREVPYTLRVGGNYSNTRLGPKRYSDSAGLSSSLSIAWHKKATLVTRHSVTWEKFKYDSPEPARYSLDGATHSYGAEHYLQLLGEKLVWGAGYEWRVSDTKGSQFKRDGHHLFTSANIALPRRMSLSSRIGYTNTDHTKYDPLPKRLDQVITTSTTLTLPVRSGDNVFLSLGHTYLYSNSKVDFANYRRNLFRVSLNFYI